jgi:hypothetical protein
VDWPGRMGRPFRAWIGVGARGPGAFPRAVVVCPFGAGERLLVIGEGERAWDGSSFFLRSVRCTSDEIQFDSASREAAKERRK